MTATAVCAPVAWMVVELDMMNAGGSNCGRKVTWLGPNVWSSCIYRSCHLYRSALQNSYLKHFHVAYGLHCPATSLKIARQVDNLAGLTFPNVKIVVKVKLMAEQNQARIAKKLRKAFKYWHVCVMIAPLFYNAKSVSILIDMCKLQTDF